MLPEVRAEETQRRKCSFQECSRENQWGRGANEVGERKNDVKSSVTLLFPEVGLDGSWGKFKSRCNMGGAPGLGWEKGGSTWDLRVWRPKGDSPSGEMQSGESSL